MTLFPCRRIVPSLPRLLGCLVAGVSLAGLACCAPRSCANPYVLDFLDRADAQADIAHVGLLADPVVTVSGPTPDRLSCSVWEKVRRPADGKVTLRPQYFSLRQVGDGWELDPPPTP